MRWIAHARLLRYRNYLALMDAKSDGGFRHYDFAFVDQFFKQSTEVNHSLVKVTILTTWGSPDAFPFAMSAVVIGESGFLPSQLWKSPLWTWNGVRYDLVSFLQAFESLFEEFPSFSNP
jgi:hypothetical protein